MSLLDIFMALWFITTFAFGFWMYFRGARKQLEKCVRFRHCDWMTDDRWTREADISTRNESIFHF